MMKLHRNATIAHEKMVNYLLQWRPENDKSRFLGSAGYTEKDGEQLAQDIRDQLLSLEAKFEETTEYGDMYSIMGLLIGPKWTSDTRHEHLDGRIDNKRDKVYYAVSEEGRLNVLSTFYT